MEISSLSLALALNTNAMVIQILLLLAKIVCIGVSNPPQKHHLLFFAKPRPLKSAKLFKPPFLGNSP